MLYRIVSPVNSVGSTFCIPLTYNDYTIWYASSPKCCFAILNICMKKLPIFVLTVDPIFCASGILNKTLLLDVLHLLQTALSLHIYIYIYIYIYDK
jgi:hypothetical protein